MKTGIDAIAFDVAQLHLPIKTLATARNIEPEKLEKGLGLIKMTLPCSPRHGSFWCQCIDQTSSRQPN